MRFDAIEPQRPVKWLSRVPFQVLLQFQVPWRFPTQNKRTVWLMWLKWLDVLWHVVYSRSIEY